MVGIAILLICGAYSANVKGISYKIVMNGKQPGEAGHRARVALARVITGGFALVGGYMIFKSAAVLLG